MVALYIRHIRTITKGSQFQNFSTFTCVNMMTSTATGAGGMWDLKPSEGNVFVRGKPVCDDSWGQEEANVVCRFVFLFSLSKCQTHTASLKNFSFTISFFFSQRGRGNPPLRNEDSVNGYFKPFPRSLGYSGGRATKESRYGNIPGGDFGMDDVRCQVRPSSFLKNT